LLALTAASGAALVYGILHHKRPSPDAKPATTAAAVAPRAGIQDEAARATAFPAAVAPKSPDKGDVIIPAFDVALVGQAGDAVIAGTAAVGATVELLRNGDPLDRVVADQSGRFVMTPSRLPPGNYDLTLRSRQGNGKLATSRTSVPIKVQPSLADDKIPPITSDKANILPVDPMVSSTVRHPLRTRREATGPAAQNLSGLRPKLFNRVVGSSHR
jgi:hypothetical protein